jgi:kynureninase
MTYQPTLTFAEQMDRQEPLRHFRNEFLFPQHKDKNCIYFCGNSLGLQPKGARAALEEELEQWRMEGVEGWFRGKRPWLPSHEYLTPTLAEVVGAKQAEVIVMNTLTVNLHLLMVSFYRPDRERFKIIMEAGAFPSDQYAVESQVKFHGFDPGEAIVEVAPRAGEALLRTDDIRQTIEAHGAETALILFGGINYYTGQYYDLPAIAEAGHRAGALVGYDLAHAAGNVPLQLHHWGVDFAVWCSYKYMNAGPGGPGGAFIHEKHHDDPNLPRFAGWWGYKEADRFRMTKGFVPEAGAAGWQISTAQVFNFAVHRVSLQHFAEAGMPALRKKSLALTGYLEFLIDQLREEGHHFNIITPRDPEARGCQLSFLTGDNGRALFDFLAANGVICDWREPNVIRIAPVPLYNSFRDVFAFTELLRDFERPG